MIFMPLVGGRKVIRPVKKLPLTVSCFIKIQVGFTVLVSAHLGSPVKRAIKHV